MCDEPQSGMLKLEMTILEYVNHDIAVAMSSSRADSVLGLNIKLDLQSIGSSPDLHILCTRDTNNDPIQVRDWGLHLNLGHIEHITLINFSLIM